MLIRLQTQWKGVKFHLLLSILAGTATGAVVALMTAGSGSAVHADVATVRIPEIAPVGLASPPTIVLKSGFQDGKEDGKAVQGTVNQGTVKKHGVFHGLASWYGGVFNGRKTASGETFDMHELTACHPTLPFGSLVRVINRRNQRSVVVRINDRGDLVDDRRVIDLSWAAAEKLAMTRSGVAKVDLEVLSLGGEHGSN